MPPGELQAALAHVGDEDPGTGELGELDDGQADGACAHHQHVLARLGVRSRHRVGADAERLDQGELVERELARRMQLACGQDEPLAHPTVGMHAEAPERDAAVRLAAAAGDAGAAVELR